MSAALALDVAPSTLPGRAVLDPGPYRALVVGDDLAPGTACDLSIVVVTHQSAAVIGACLTSLRMLDPRLLVEVIVVDNASTDGTAELVADAHPDVRLLRKRGRHGFSLNCNIGAAVATGRHVMLLNPDTVVRPGAVEALVEHLDRHPEVGAVSPKLVYPDGSDQHGARRFPTLGSFLLRRTPLRLLVTRGSADRTQLMTADVLDQVTDIDWALGAALVLRRDAYAGVGGFDEGYRLYCEDIDLCWRLHEAGWRVQTLPHAVVQHDLAELTRRRFLTRRTLWHLASMARFVRLHGLGRAPHATHGTGPIPVASLAITR